MDGLTKVFQIEPNDGVTEPRGLFSTERQEHYRLSQVEVHYYETSKIKTEQNYYNNPRCVTDTGSACDTDIAARKRATLS